MDTKFLVVVVAVGLMACGAPSDEELTAEYEGQSQELGGYFSNHPLIEGRRLFRDEEFGGNGRTCQSCHSATTGTLTLPQIPRSLSA